MNTTDYSRLIHYLIATRAYPFTNTDGTMVKPAIAVNDVELIADLAGWIGQLTLSKRMQDTDSVKILTTAIEKSCQIDDIDLADYMAWMKDNPDDFGDDNNEIYREDTYSI